MPDNNVPAPNSDPEILPGEFDFAKPVPETPRVKRRSLKPAPTAPLKPAGDVPSGAKELAREAPSLSPEETVPEYASDPREDADAEPNASVEMHEPEPQRPPPSRGKTSQPYVRPAARPSAAPSQPASPHGTRPATLYYSTGRKEKETASPTPTSTPMKSTPTASTAPSASTQTTTPARSTASTVRPSSVVDYRTNVERQSREQKSVGSVLAYLVYALIGLFCLGSILAGYGAYTVTRQLHEQSMTVAELDRHYSSENLQINAKLASTLDTLTQAQAQIGRQQDLIIKQQEMINKLLASAQDNASAIRQERQIRADQNANIQTRLRNLEYKGPGTTTQRY